jgi:hypothetical protein
MDIDALSGSKGLPEAGIAIDLIQRMAGSLVPEGQNAQNALVVAMAERLAVWASPGPLLAHENLSAVGESESFLKEACRSLPYPEAEEAPENLLGLLLLPSHLEGIAKGGCTPSAICLSGILQETEAGCLSL